MAQEHKSDIYITNNFNAPIGQHIDHVDTIQFHMDGDGTFHFGRVENARVEKQEAARGSMPDALTTEVAERYWQRLREQRFVDADCRLLPSTTRKEAMCIADLFAEKLKLKAKWSLFQALWGISNLAQEKWECQQTGILPSRYKDIERIFKD